MFFCEYYISCSALFNPFHGDLISPFPNKLDKKVKIQVLPIRNNLYSHYFSTCDTNIHNRAELPQINSILI